ncbi:MAG: BrxA/BrxB family bacilliredoxin [Acidobacteria bacterium]|nr:BrxA/BrxB family bacilliredoxin [Acidobacteriota bacterium]
MALPQPTERLARGPIVVKECVVEIAKKDRHRIIDAIRSVQVPYPEYLVAPMRQELTDLGARECRTAADVDAVVASPGVVMMVVNSVCGCAAGKARPGIGMALNHANKPDTLATVFAGADVEATDRARQYFTGIAPSSPSIALMQDGKLLYMIERRDIESRTAEAIADQLTMAFDRFCVAPTVV